MKKNKSESITSNIIFNLIKTVSNVIFPVITFSYSSKILGAEGVGKVNFAKAIISYFSLFAMLGMNYYGVREAAKLRDDKQKLSMFVHEMLFINGFTTCLSYIVLVISIIFVTRFQEYTLLLFINSLSIIMMGMGLEWLYQALEKYRYISLRAIAFKILALLLMVLTVRDAHDVTNYMIVSTLASSGSYILNFYNSRKYVDFHWFGNYDIKKHLKPILRLFALALSIELYTVLDTTMLGFIKGDTDVGVYSAAIKINRIAISVISSIGTVLVPRLSYYMGHGNKEQFMSLNTKVYQFVFMFSIPICIGIFMLSDEIVRIFCGNGFEDAGVTMKLLTPILLVIPISSVISNQTFFPLGKEKCILISTCIGAVTNFMLNTVLIPKYSYKGAAIATVIAESMVLLVCMIQLKRLFSIKRIFKGYYQYWMAALPIILIVYFIQWCGFGDVFTILFSVIIAAIVYFGILLLCRNVFIIEIIQFIINRFHRIIEDRRI